MEAQNYQLGKVVGQGTHGVVKEIIDGTSKEKLACKIMPDDKLKPQEIEIWKELSGHPNLLSLKSVFHKGLITYTVTDLCEGRDVCKFVEKYGPFPQKESAHITQSLMKAVQYCHDHGIIHRDVKLDNILFTSSTSLTDIKLGDFGTASRFRKGELLFEDAGSLPYVAPEVQDSRGYSKEADIWSAGVVLYILLTGNFPFGDDDSDIVRRDIMRGPIHFEIDEDEQIPFAAKDLVKGMLNRNVKERLTTNQILGHPWILEHTGNRD